MKNRKELSVRRHRGGSRSLCGGGMSTALITTATTTMIIVLLLMLIMLGSVSKTTAEAVVEEDVLISSSRMSISNMTCDYFRQPLNHFVPKGNSPSYEQRYCIYDGYTNIDIDSSSSSPSPIFFYTGNESPLEQYINHTGLIWELAPKLNAKVVFVEHRYEGESLPNISKDCLSYASTIQALEDYAIILQERINPNNLSPVIAFGGSYGGMLSSWMRMKYPHLIAGAIAASAPIGAFPQSANTKIDYSARVLANGIDQSYPPNKPTATKTTEDSLSLTHQQIDDDDDDEDVLQQQTQKQQKSLALQRILRADDIEEKVEVEEENHCRTNLLAAWPLIRWLARQGENKYGKLIQDSFSLCEPLWSSSSSSGRRGGNSAKALLRWAQGIWFNLAEGSFPYPSNYIPFSLLHTTLELPAWPMQHACWKSSQLHKDWNIKFHYDCSEEDGKYHIEYGNSRLQLKVDWDTVVDVNSSHNNVTEKNKIEESKDIIGLLTSVRDAVSIWYNITKDVECYNVSKVAPNKNAKMRRRRRSIMKSLNDNNEDDGNDPSSKKPDPVKVCEDAIKQDGSWTPLCCNDEINLVITEARGLGNDFFWPPSHPRSVKTYKDAIRNETFEPCEDPYDVYGYSKLPYDPFSIRLDAYYGNSGSRTLRNGKHTNIIFSNGLLDPWSAGGIYNEYPDTTTNNNRYRWKDQAIVQNITDDDSIIALIIPYGGHHTDLMYRNSTSDPNCVTEARRIEEEYIRRWIQRWGD